VKRLFPQLKLIFFKKYALDIFVVGIIGYFILQRLPGLIEMHKAEGQAAPSAQVFTLEGNKIALPREGRHILIFWATWCGPCKVELARINRMVRAGEISSDSILAISVAEDPHLVASFAREEEYQFPIAVDPTSSAASAYKVGGTPTLVLIDQDSLISWMTTGISPSLELRFRAFLN
jgi:thiol-disulfide isomerase/thioredoxin